MLRQLRQSELKMIQESYRKGLGVESVLMRFYLLLNRAFRDLRHSILSHGFSLFLSGGFVTFSSVRIVPPLSRALGQRMHLAVEVRGDRPAKDAAQTQL